MNQYIIKGGKSLAGEVTIGGAKNAALGILAGAIMTDDEVTIENAPYDYVDLNLSFIPIDLLADVVPCRTGPCCRE